MKIGYVLCPVAFLVIACDCPCDPPDLGTDVVVCRKDNNGVSMPVLVNSKGGSVSSPNSNFAANDWSCPDTKESPIWTNSEGSKYTQGGKSASSSNGARTAAADTAAYLPRAILDLPFSARPSASDNTSVACDSSYPDILQVNHDRASVNRISSCGFKMLATIPVATRPLQIAFTPDGLTALVTSFDNAVNFIDLASNRVTFTLTTAFDVNPHGIAVSSDGARAYITSFNTENAQVAVIDMALRKVITSISVTSYPQTATLTPDDSQLYVTFPLGDAVYIIDTLTNTVARTLSVAAPRSVVFNSVGTRAYISSASGSPGTVQELDTETLKVIRSFVVGLGPTDLKVLYGDQTVMVTNYEGQSVSTINLGTGLVTTLAMGGPVSGLTIVH